MNLQLEQREYNSHVSSLKMNVVYVGGEFFEEISNRFEKYYAVNRKISFGDFETSMKNLPFQNLPDAILMEVDKSGQCFLCIDNLRKIPSLRGIIIILLSKEDSKEFKDRALSVKVHDYYTYPFDVITLHERLKFLFKVRIINPYFQNRENDYQENLSYKIPFSKRLFDILLSAAALFFLSPLFLLIAFLIKIDSNGSIIYHSKRVGTGYKVFDFYKFRSMTDVADSQLANLNDFNQYSSEDVKRSVFIKIVNDPRVTRIGLLIRKTSLDELPQLFNILLGDMSFVGNRPLPLYEAEQLTSNEWSMRFHGPAGLTGLWQITKRGNEKMSELERKQLDNFYAKSHSFWIDLKILFKTFPALLQKEKV